MKLWLGRTKPHIIRTTERGPAILDNFSRRIIAYTISRTLDTTVILDSSRTAIAGRYSTGGVARHSDQGMQYVSGLCVQGLRRHCFAIGTARAVNPYDNAAVEKFFETLKYEEVYLTRHRTFEDVEGGLP